MILPDETDQRDKTDETDETEEQSAQLHASAQLNCILREYLPGFARDVRDQPRDALGYRWQPIELGGQTAVSMQQLPQHGPHEQPDQHRPQPPSTVQWRIRTTHWSTAGAHRFASPPERAQSPSPFAPCSWSALLDALQTAIAQHSNDEDANDAASSDLLELMKQSRRQSTYLLKGRPEAAISARLRRSDPFLAAETQLFAGHAFHPTPKSRCGFDDDQLLRYSPETSRGFPLHFFAIAPQLHVCEQVGGPAVGDELLQYAGPQLRERVPSGWSVHPLHPWQAQHLEHTGEIKALVRSNCVIDLGSGHQLFMPTASVRTLYAPECRYMLKCSLSVGITNSKRINQLREMYRGLDMHRFFNAPDLQDYLETHCGTLTVMSDPGFCSLRRDATAPNSVLDAWSVSLRWNPFHTDYGYSRSCALAAGLCERPPDGRPSLLSLALHELATHNARSIKDAGLLWWSAFMATVVRPILRLYCERGVLLEAHQQNTVIRSKSGLPIGCFYRDGQGFYLCEGARQRLDAAAPGIGERSASFVPEAFIDSVAEYYLVINLVYGVMAALSAESGIAEAEFCRQLRRELRAIEDDATYGRALIRQLLCDPNIRCKANLRTKAAGIDELEAPIERQSRYVEMPNPLVHPQNPGQTRAQPASSGPRPTRQGCSQ